MPKVAIVGTVDVVPGRRDQLIPLLMAHRGRCLKDQPGTLKFEVLAPRDDDARVLLFELYQDDAAFQEYLNSASLARLKEEASGIMAKVTATRCVLIE